MMQIFAGLMEVVDKKADAPTLLKMIIEKLKDYGIDFNSIKFFTADGARVNSALGRMSGKFMQACQNHGLHLGILFNTILLYFTIV